MLNPALDLTAAARAFAVHGRLQLRQFLEPTVADSLHGCLDAEVPWGLTCTTAAGAPPVLLQAAALNSQEAAARAELYRQADRQRREGFAFHYWTYMMVTAYRERRDPGLLLHRMVEWLNAPEFLGAVADITGEPGLRKANAQATRYLPGDFLTRHDDSSVPGRRIAYVINLTRDWQPEWGGTLQFVDAADAVVESYTPHFNSLSLFRVPMWHRVYEVAAQATRPRYAITGWLFDR